MDTSEKYLSKCAELYTHINKPELIANEQGVLNLPTNRFLALEGVRTWYDNAIFQPIAISTRPEAAIKYMVFSVINTLSGRVSENEYSQVDPYFAVNRNAYNTIFTEFAGKLYIVDGQLKLAVLLIEKFTELKNKLSCDNGEARLDYIRRFICEEFFNYLTPYQLLFIQSVLGCSSLSGKSMWYFDDKTSRLFNSPDDVMYSLINNEAISPYFHLMYYPKCADNQLEHYITRSICTLFNHPVADFKLTLAQLHDVINILDLPETLVNKLKQYMWLLNSTQCNIVYL
jgi:hypothetical protein